MKKLFVVGIILILLAGAVAPASAGILSDILEFFFPPQFLESTESIEGIKNTTLFGVGGITQQSNEPIIIYGDGWKKTTYPDGYIQYTYGVRTYLRHDGVYRPWVELNFETGDWPYKVTEYLNYYLIEADGISFKLPKRNWIDYEFRLDTIKETMHIPTLQALIDRSIVHEAGIRYIPLEFTPSQVASVNQNFVELGRFKTKDFWIRDNGTLEWNAEGGEWYRNYSYYDVANHYELKIINGEIRLYFDDLAWFQNAQYPLVIDPTWTLSGSIGSAWTNVEHDNTTSVISTGDVELRKEVDDYISYWRFDENTGITQWDENATSNNTGTWSGSATANYTTGKYGYGLDFDGTDDYIDCGNVNPITGITVSAWVKSNTTTWSANGCMVSKRNAYVLYPGIGSKDVYFFIWREGEDYNHSGGATIADITVWHHYVGTYDSVSGILNLYVDGVYKAGTTVSGGGTLNPDAGSVYIGWDDGQTGRYINGTIDSVSTYNRALTNDEINLTMNNSHYIEGNLTSWHDALSGNETYKLSANFTFPANTNASINLYNNDTGAFIENLASHTTTADWNATITSPVQDSKVNITLYGNVTQTPEIHNVTFHTQAAAAPGAAPVITLLSQSPSLLYENSTGYFNVSYGITHAAAGLNNTSVSFIYTNYDTTDGSYNHSVRPPANNRTAVWNPFGERILRADNRNGTLNFEDNATITGGNVYEWGGGDENVSRMTIVPINNTYTKVYWNGTIQDTVSSSMWYLDRTDIQAAAKTEYAVYKNHGLLTKIWDIEALETHNGYILNVWVDSHLGALTPNKPVHLWYLNESYYPTGAVDPTDSPYAFYVTSHNATMWTDYEYSPSISTYVNAFYVNQTTVEAGDVVMTNKSWIYLESETASSKPYYVNTTNAASTTNRTFAETNVTYSGEAAPLTLIAYTANIFAEFKHDGHQYQMKLYAADNNGNWSNSTLNTTNIGDVNFPPTYPGFGWFWYNGVEDEDMDGTYQGTFDMIIGVGTDPDGGNTTHNLTLHYANETYVATINNTFNASDATGGIINITIDSSLYYICEDYTLKVTATDDSGLFSESWLGSTFQLHASAPNITTWYNNVTSNTNTSFTVNQSECVYFNATANQTITTWTWKLNGTDQSHNFDNISLCFDSIGIHTVKVYGTNANCSSQTITWTVTVEEDLTLSYLYALYLSIIKENEMLAQVWLFLILLLIAFAFLAVGYLSVNGTFKIFGAAFSSLLFILLAYAVIGNQFGEMLQMAWLATLLVALGLIQSIFTILLVISLLYMMFVSKREAGVDSIPFDPSTKNW